MKRGQYFTIDAFIAMVVISTSIFVLFGLYTSAPQPDQPRIISQELINFLSQTRVNEVSDPLVQNLIRNGTITKLDYSLMQQAADFHVNEPDFPNTNLSGVFLRNMTGSVPDQFSFEIYIDNSVNPVYNRGGGSQDATLLISTKRTTFGVREIDNTVWGPVVVEVRVWQ